MTPWFTALQVLPFRRVALARALPGILVTLSACAAPPPAPVSAQDAPVRRHATAPYLLHVTCPHVPDPLPGEAPPQPPSASKQALQPGHWDWVDGSYAWVAPSWHTRGEGPDRPWQDGYWEANGGACVWHAGRYLRAALQ